MSTVMSDFLLYISHELFQRELHVEEYWNTGQSASQISRLFPQTENKSLVQFH